MTGLFFWMPVLVPLTSLLATVASFLFDENKEFLRGSVNVSIAVVKVLMVGWLMFGVSQGDFFEFRMPLFLEFDLVLQADALSLLFALLSSILWLLTTIYAIGYFKGGENQARFFGFFNLCVFATTAIALSGNLFTFLVFYELLTVTTYPLVVHKGSQAALSAGRVYLVYTLSAGAWLLLAMVWFSSIAGAVDFQQRGILAGLDPALYPQLTAIFFMLISGFGVKAALFPLHGWLPIAMIAPAPVSALLHAVAVVKAGAFGIIRTVYDIYGIEFCQKQGFLFILAAVSAVTIIYGSLMALRQDDIKRRLAYSTVSQVSYIMLGVATLSVTASVGGIIQLVHQGIMKITLFLSAGNFQHEMNISNVSQMDGVGKKMPWSMAAFTVGALGMIGVPPMAGFMTKWFIGLGAMEASQPWILGTLLISSALNAMYFLPPIFRGWFKPPSREVLGMTPFQARSLKPLLLVPPATTAVLTILIGLLADMPLFPLQWVKLIVLREYGG